MMNRRGNYANLSRTDLGRLRKSSCIYAFKVKYHMLSLKILKRIIPFHHRKSGRENS